MATPEYFQQFPNIKYAFKIDKSGRPIGCDIKDYFRRMTVRDDIYKFDTMYNDYEIKNYERPDQISFELYDDEQYYWTILQTNNITDYYNQWPLSSVEFEKYVVKKYGGWDEAHAVHHYETVKELDSDGNLVLPKGIIVDKDYRYGYRMSRNDDDLKYSYPREVSNWEYEYELNEEKANISIIREEYIPDIMRDIKNYARELRKMSSELTLGTINRD